MSLEPRCAMCHKPALGFATINDERYCHPDDPAQQDCFSLAQLSEGDFLRYLCGDEMEELNIVGRAVNAPKEEDIEW